MPVETKNPLSNALQLISRSLIGASVDDEIGSSIKTSWRRRFCGALLLFMYVWVFYVVMMSLTAYQIQTRVQALGENGQRQSIWGITRIAGELFQIQDEFNNNNNRLIALEKEIYLAEAKITKNDSNYYAARSTLIGYLRLADIQLSSDKIDLVLDNSDRAAENGNIDDSFRLLAIAQENRTVLQAFDGSLDALEEFRTATLDLVNAEQEKYRKSKELSALLIRKGYLKTNLDVFNSTYDKNVELIDELHFFYYPPGHASSWIGSIYAFMFGGGSEIDSSKVRYGFVTLPSEVLMILIVIAMGTMGSLINITQVFFAGEDREITFFLFRPLLGAVVAIGIYVITKAGVLVSSNVAANSGGVAKLNAFFVSFISLIAGLMSEAAITTIKSSGTRFLRGDAVTEKARYANGVKAKMTSDGKENKDLYPFFEVAPVEIDNWLSENELVPNDAQRVIAAWLEKPVRNLFSDLRPPTNQAPSGQPGQTPDAEPVKRQSDASKPVQ